MRAHAGEGGGVLIEFALVSTILLLLLGALFDFGRVFYAAQQSQRAVQLAAREIALLPLPPSGAALRDALACRRTQIGDPGFPQCAALAGVPLLPREAVFDSDYLAFGCDWLLANRGLDCHVRGDLELFARTLPPVNRALWPLMIWDRPLAGCPDARPCLLRYPGALVQDPTSATQRSVRVPLLTSAGEVVSCAPVLQAVEDGGVDAFAVESGGLVELRLHYPLQSVSLLAAGSAEGNDPVEAGPAACPEVAALETLGPEAVAGATPGFGPNAGPLGLGRQLARASALRPYRRVVASEALARRELYF